MKVSATTFDLVDSFLSGQSAVRQYDSDLCIVNWRYKPKIWLIGNEKQRNLRTWSRFIHADFPPDGPPRNGAPYYELGDERSVVTAIEAIENMAFNAEKDGLIVLNLSQISDDSFLRSVVFSFSDLDDLTLSEEIPLWIQALRVDRCFAPLIFNEIDTIWIRSKSWRESSIFEYIHEILREGLPYVNLGQYIITDREFEQQTSYALRDKYREIIEITDRCSIFDFVRGDSFNSRNVPFDSYIDTNSHLLSSMKMMLQLKALAANTRFPTRLWIGDNG